MKKLFYSLLFCGAFLGVYTDVILSGSEESRYETLRFAQGDIIENVEDIRIDNALEGNCEHNIPIIECDGCRYEVGVVKVDSEFLKKEGMLELAEAKESTLNSIIEAPGEISTNPDREVHITPRIPGIIKEVYKGLGDKVTAGETVVLLDSIEFGQAKSDYLKAKAMMELAGKNYDRVKTLSEKQVVSQKTFIEAESELERARIELRALEERLHLLGMKDSDVQKIREHEEFQSLLPIIAPFDGTVIEKHAVIGERVDVGFGLFRVADLTRLWVWFDVYEKDLAKVKNGQNVSLLVLAYPDENFEGQITYIGNTVSEKTRTTKVQAEVDN
ncbi:MAG: efflux RND transporter periplasmic adaptor subunit, partial [Planctomycetes bacterium]|nr:efflux RND transporter periplasmic adaptor subunit [Planctomycetota bacterium]